MLFTFYSRDLLHRYHMLRPARGHAQTGQLHRGEKGEQVRGTEVHRTASFDPQHQVRHSTVVRCDRLESVDALVLQGFLFALLLSRVHARQSGRVRVFMSTFYIVYHKDICLGSKGNVTFISCDAIMPLALVCKILDSCLLISRPLRLAEYLYG